MKFGATRKYGVQSRRASPRRTLRVTLPWLFTLRNSATTLPDQPSAVGSTAETRGTAQVSCRHFTYAGQQRCSDPRSMLTSPHRSTALALE